MTKNNNETFEEEYCDCKCAPAEEIPIWDYHISLEAPVMFRELHEIIHLGEGNLFIAFEMGSIRLSLSNPLNYLEVNRTYVKIYNEETGETSIIRTDKITGFIYEPEMEVHLEDIEVTKE